MLSLLYFNRIEKLWKMDLKLLLSFLQWWILGFPVLGITFLYQAKKPSQMKK